MIKINKILIVQTAFIGDAILITPIIETIKANYPNVKVDLLIRQGNQSLFDANPLINNVLVWDKKKNKYKNLFNLIFKIRKTKYDALINAQRFISTAILTLFSKSKYKVVFESNTLSFLFKIKAKHQFKEDYHEVDRNILLLKTLFDKINIPLHKIERKPKLYPSKNDYLSVEKYKKQKYICIAPCSVWKTKEFPAEKWIELIDKLDSVDIFLLGSTEEYNKCEQIRTNTSSKSVVNLCGELNLLESAALMQDAIVNFTNDSASLHLASSVNANICAVFCSTIPYFGFYPLSDNSYLLEITNKLSCRPCNNHGKSACPQKHFNCAYNIDIHYIVDIFNKKIKKNFFEK